MRARSLLFGLLSSLGLAAAQTSEQWRDADNGIVFQAIQEPIYGVVFAGSFPADNTRTEFIGEVIAPNEIGWVGWAIGGGMLQNPLLVFWRNGDKTVATIRMATTYALPAQYAGSKITELPGSKANATHWKFVFRCEGCTKWTTTMGEPGSMQEDGQLQGYGLSPYPVSEPANPNSAFGQHTDFGFFVHMIADGRSANYDRYLTGQPVQTSDGPSPTSAVSASSSVRPTTSTSIPITTAIPTPYDYIVVGAGPAGLVIADRLSEAGKSVLLLERGGASTKNTGGTREVPEWAAETGLTRFDIPGLFESMFGSEDAWWWCNDVNVFAGCLVGGGTVINGMLYYYPPTREFSSLYGWPQEWNDVNPWVDKLAARLPSTDTPSPDGVRYLDQVYTLLKGHFSKKGYSEATINSVKDSKDSVFGHPAYNLIGGKRTGPTATYYETSKVRPNFKLLTWTYAQSLVRNGSTITGVLTNNTADLPYGLATLKPGGRVVLSGGVYGTSRLLFQSGIGPADMLSIIEGSDAAHFLPPKEQYINLPVGYHVQDNPSINLVFTHPEVDDFDNWQPIWRQPRSAEATQYVKDQTGVFAASSPRFNFWKAIGGRDGRTRWLQGTARPGGWPSTELPYNETARFTITFYLSTGITSRGRVGIDAALRGRTLENPWLNDIHDKEAIVTGIKDAITGLDENLPGIIRITPDNTTTLDDFINAYDPPSMNSNHWIGSTRIGTNATTAVVDKNTKVFGTDNLFIVDAGIIPSQPMSNPHASIMVVAEMAAAKILALP